MSYTCPITKKTYTRTLAQKWDSLEYQSLYGLDPKAAAKAARADRAQWVRQWQKDNTDPTLELRVWCLPSRLHTVYFVDFCRVS